MKAKDCFDYVVIGGGSAGCVVAARLAEERCGSVLLLEAGQSERENPEIMTANGFKYTFSNENTMWDRTSVPHPGAGNRSVYCGSGTGLGGSGSVNGMVYTRGDKQDFTTWPSTWQWQQVKPYYEALEQRLRIRQRSPTRFTEACIKACEQLGFERKNGLNDGNLCGFMGYNDMNFEGDQRRSSYMAFIQGREAELDLLTVRTQAQVLKIHFDEHKSAEAVEFSLGGSTHTVNIRKEVILCAGALETPKLLMLSGVGPQSELEKHQIPLVADVSNLGMNLQDHPNVCIFYQANRPIDFFFPQLYGFQRLNPSLKLPVGQADTCLTFFSVPSVIQETLKKMVPQILLPSRLHRIRSLRFGLRRLVDLTFKLPPLQKFVDRLYGIIVILGKPVSRGRLRLKSANPQDQAVIDLAYYADPQDLHTMISGIALANRIAQQSSLRTWGSKLLSKASASDSPAVVKRWLDRATMTTYHYCGTCSMGEEETAPVTPELKLRGVRNVRVADASVMPEVPVSATNAPSMMIGYRAVEFIVSEHKKPCDMSVCA